MKTEIMLAILKKHGVTDHKDLEKIFEKAEKLDEIEEKVSEFFTEGDNEKEGLEEIGEYIACEFDWL